jgi:Uma2 family endonuclease
VDDDGPTLLARYPAVSRHVFTVDDYHRLGEAGILAEDDRVELIEGELVEMSPIGSEHAACVGALNRLLILALGERGIVFPQSPVRLDQRNEPQPDFAVLRPRPHGYRSALPIPQDVFLIIEVAASSLAYDRGLKLALYARHGVPEVWIINLAAQEIEVFRKPVSDRYESSAHVNRSGSLEIEALPGVRIEVDRIFG